MGLLKLISGKSTKIGLNDALPPSFHPDTENTFGIFCKMIFFAIIFFHFSTFAQIMNIEAPALFE